MQVPKNLWQAMKEKYQNDTTLSASVETKVRTVMKCMKYAWNKRQMYIISRKYQRHSYVMVLDSADRASSTVWRPSRSSRQMLCNCCCRRTVERFVRLTGGWPRACCSRIVVADAESCCSDSTATQNDGCVCPTSALKPRFHASHWLLVRSVPFSVASWTFHSDGGKSGCRRRITRRGISAASVAGRCTRLTAPDTYVLSKYVNRCWSWTVSAQTGMFSCRYRIPAGTSGSGKYATASIILTNFLTDSLFLYACTRPSSCTLRQVLWHRWKKQPFTSTCAPSVALTALIAADSKSQMTVVGSALTPILSQALITARSRRSYIVCDFPNAQQPTNQKNQRRYYPPFPSPSISPSPSIPLHPLLLWSGPL